MDEDAADSHTAFTRRQVLIGSAAAVAGILAGCSSGDDDSAPDTTGDGDAGTTRPPPELPSDPFTLGAASGDPLADAVVLWTRLAPDPLAADGLGGMPDEEVDVRWEVATDEAFADVVRSGTAVATSAHAHAVHVDVDGLQAATDYHYRFTVGDHVSPVARTRTLPEGSPERFRLAVVNCQWFETGAYAAYRHLAESEVDLVMHLGDYIYEYAANTESDRAVAPANALETLTDYRLRYASYRLDPDLRAAHERFPWVLTWDDHEVGNNYMGDVLQSDPDPEVGKARRAAGYQAWWEHLPVRVAAPEGPDLDIYQHLDVGDLARLYLLDERQHSDVPPCRDTSTATLDFGDCAARTEDRARLGDAQEAWLGDALAESGATWNLIGNPVVLGGIDGGNAEDGPQYYLDTWDGFPTGRQRLIEQLAGVKNPVVLTGDYHAGMVIDVHERPFEQATPIVAPELMAPPISSPLFAANVSDRTPQVRRQLNGHGYLAVDVTPERLTATFEVLADVTDPDSAISTALTCTIDAGSPDVVLQG